MRLQRYSPALQVAVRPAPPCVTAARWRGVAWRGEAGCGGVLRPFNQAEEQGAIIITNLWSLPADPPRVINKTDGVMSRIEGLGLGGRSHGRSRGTRGVLESRTKGGRARRGAQAGSRGGSR